MKDLSESGQCNNVAHAVTLLGCSHPEKGPNTCSPYLGGVIMGALITFPAAAVDPGDARQTQLALIDLEGLVFDHAPSVSPASTSQTSHGPDGRCNIILGQRITNATFKDLKSLICFGIQFLKSKAGFLLPVGDSCR